MTYQDKISLIQDSQAQLENGGSWADFQGQLAAIPDLYPKDVANTTNKVLGALEAKYEARIDEQLNDTGEAAPIGNLHPETFNRLVDSRKKTIQNRLSRRISNELMKGARPEQVAAHNAHPLLTKEVLESAVKNANTRVLAQQESDGEGSGSWAIWLVVSIIIIVIKIMLRSS